MANKKNKTSKSNSDSNNNNANNNNNNNSNNNNNDNDNKHNTSQPSKDYFSTIDLDFSTLSFTPFRLFIHKSILNDKDICQETNNFYVLDFEIPNGPDNNTLILSKSCDEGGRKKNMIKEDAKSSTTTTTTTTDITIIVDDLMSDNINHLDDKFSLDDMDSAEVDNTTTTTTSDSDFEHYDIDLQDMIDAQAEIKEIEHLAIEFILANKKEYSL